MEQETTISDEISAIKSELSEIKSLVEGLIFAYNQQYSLPESGNLPYPPLKITY